jgi:hypothetical protein
MDPLRGIAMGIAAPHFSLSHPCNGLARVSELTFKDRVVLEPGL